MRTTDLRAAALARADDDLTPAERRREIAAILARGVLRLRPGVHTSPGTGEFRPPKKVSKSRRNCLEGVGTSSPHLPRG